MEFLIKVCIRLIKIVYEIIEAVIRSLLEVLIPILFIFVAISFCIIGGLLVVRYGACTGENVCFDRQTISSCIKLAGYTFTLYAAYTVVKFWFK